MDFIYCRKYSELPERMGEAALSIHVPIIINSEMVGTSNLKYKGCNPLIDRQRTRKQNTLMAKSQTATGNVSKLKTLKGAIEKPIGSKNSNMILSISPFELSLLYFDAMETSGAACISLGNVRCQVFGKGAQEVVLGMPAPVAASRVVVYIFAP